MERTNVAIPALFLAIFLLAIPGWSATHARHIHRAGLHQAAVTATAPVVDIVRDAADVPPSVGTRAATTVHVDLTAEEVDGRLDADSSTTYRYWTFNGKVPGPMIRVRQGDTVEVTLHNDAANQMPHSIDLHAALGPGGGAVLSSALPGETKTFTFQATTPGLFVYHCGTQMMAEHISNGMYGLILVEPAGGLAPVAHEYYVMQGELYTAQPMGTEGLQKFSADRLLDERPTYVLDNGAVGAVTEQHPMHAAANDTVRIFYGDAGPNLAASLHVSGAIFSRVYQYGSLSSRPLAQVQTALVPAGGAVILEINFPEPGRYQLLDHSMSRMGKGAAAWIEVSGVPNPALMHAGPADGMTKQTEPAASAGSN